MDKSHTAIIELLGNDQAEFEKNEDAVEKDEAGMKSFAEWEMGLLDQEEAYWENLLRELKMQIDDEIQTMCDRETIGLDDARRLEIRTEINIKYQPKKKLMMQGWQRAKDENEIVHRQKEYRKYQKLTMQMAYPLNSFKFKEGDFDTLHHPK